MTKLLLAVLCLCAGSPGIADIESDKREVADVVRTAVDAVVSVLEDTELDRQKKRDRVKAIIDPVFDFSLLAMLSLGRTHWEKIDATQRETFTELFTETVQLSYFEKLELFTDEVVEFEDPIVLKTKGSPKFKVLTYIVSKGDRTKVAYLLTRRESVWRVFDFEIEGVSIRKSYGSQYNDFLREESFERLLETMREKVASARKKGSEPDPSAVEEAER